MSTNNELSTSTAAGIDFDPQPELLPLLVGQHLLHGAGIVGVAGMVHGGRDHPHVSAGDRLQIDGLQAEAPEVSQPLSATGEVVRQFAGRGSEPVYSYNCHDVPLHLGQRSARQPPHRTPNEGRR